ncbi:hypothetical protein H2201_005131 [Coniosporium apollinis]|uniref:F-box domain-containing protein n=1 Tax=Coniosporium apollinis TaxID=61459 RepID=A0ABQ9NUQ4_9PEZI|nr:hypothetical protein H2201_005131 [Coniosporium apollinis]
MAIKRSSSLSGSPAKRQRIGSSSPSTNTQSTRDTSYSVETEPERKDVYSTLTEELHRMILGNIAKDDKFEPEEDDWLDHRPEKLNLALTKFDDAYWDSLRTLLSLNKAIRYAVLQHLLDNEIMRIFVEPSDDGQALEVQDIGYPALTLGAFASPDAPRFEPRYLVIIFDLDSYEIPLANTSALSAALSPLLPNIFARLRNLTLVLRPARRRKTNRYGGRRRLSSEITWVQDNLESQFWRLWRKFVQEHPALEQAIKQKKSILSLPNEILDPIFDLVLFSTKLGRRGRKSAAFYKIHRLQWIPLLLVSHRFFELGIRHLLTNDLFVFESLKDDRASRADITNIEWLPGPKLVAPDKFYPVKRPLGDSFRQLDGILLLSSLPNMSFRPIPDPLPLVTKLRIEIELPAIQMYSLSPLLFGDYVTHPFLQDSTSAAEVKKWFEAELAPQKAEYHLGILADLPFKNLKFLHLHANISGWWIIRPECWEAQAGWIGQYLFKIKILDRATTVKVTTSMGQSNLEGLIWGVMSKLSADSL